MVDGRPRCSIRTSDAREKIIPVMTASATRGLATMAPITAAAIMPRTRSRAERGDTANVNSTVAMITATNAVPADDLSTRPTVSTGVSGLSSVAGELTTGLDSPRVRRCRGTGRPGTVVCVDRLAVVGGAAATGERLERVGAQSGQPQTKQPAQQPADDAEVHRGG